MVGRREQCEQVSERAIKGKGARGRERELSEL